VLRSYRFPAGWSYPPLHDALKARGFVIYGGQGSCPLNCSASPRWATFMLRVERLLQAFIDLLQ
jgi:2-aminoethylphosphonate-pyruvate transaminase